MAIATKLKTISVTKALAAASAYAANDVMSEHATTGTIWTFADMVPDDGGEGYLTKVHAICETIGITPALVLFLFSVAPTANLNDKVANTASLHADLANYVGPIELPAMSGIGGDSESLAVPSTSGNLPLAFKCAAASKNLFGILATKDIVTVVATNDMTLRLTRELA